ncbi:MAG: hypothetical protein K8R88_02945, partial [Armatimonadetes bacterium]|nr:hypothetical protein [Armatimonadota bacterium]
MKTVNSYAVAPAATQKGESRKLEVIDCRTLAVTFSNQKLFVTHQSAANFGTGLRGCTKWYRFNVGLGTEVDETIGFTNFDCYYPAIASNLNGDASLSMAYSGATEYASIIHAGCKISETGVGGAQYIIGGLAGYFEDYGQGRNRWGDYFGSSVDWWDGLSFYGVGQYAKTTNQWQCQIWRSNYKPSYVFSVAAASGQLTGTTTLSATLTRSDTSAPLAGYSVPFSISGTYVGSGTTNASGVATFVYAIPFQVPTTRTISCSLDEDGTFNAGSGSAVLTIQKANTAVYIYNSSPTAGTTQPLYQYLYRTTDNTYVNGESLEFWVDGALRGNATMVSNLATFNFAVPIAWQGVKSMWGYYPGNTYYNASVDYGGTMTVYRPTQHNRWDAEARRTESGTMWVQYLDYNGVPIVNGDVY